MTDTILLVEDDEPLRSTLARHLRAVGYEVVEVDTTEAAAMGLRSGLRPAIVLLDINLPGETGWSLLRGSDLAAAGSPPVVVTSATAVNPRRLALESGVRVRTIWRTDGSGADLAIEPIDE